MATANLNPVFTSLSGSVGSLVFYKRYGATVMRAWVKPANPRTQAQQANRGRFKQAMTSWQTLSIEEKAAYNRKARGLGMSGHNLFISRFMRSHGQDRVDKGPVHADGTFDCGAAHLSSFTSSPLRRGGREERSSSHHPACRSVTAPSMQVMTDCTQGFTDYSG